MLTVSCTPSTKRLASRGDARDGGGTVTATVRATSKGSTSQRASYEREARVPPAVVRFADAVLRRSGVLAGSDRRDVERIDRIRAALMAVPRDQFVEPRYQGRVLEDTGLSSGFGQISPAPFLIARMLFAARIDPGATVLELGCGSGYMSALMCALGARVFAAEGIGLRAQSTRRHLDALGFNRVLIATGFLAWAEAGPFDAVIVNEEKQEPAVFERLIQLLRPGGRLVIPSSGQGIGAVSVIERGENGEAIHVL